jgi:GntR family transcriptional regulator
MADPIWRKIAEDLRLKIELGEFGRDGEPLPTELELQEQYGASRNTVRDAIKWLVTRGLVYTRSGKGTFVLQRADPFVTKLAAEGHASMEAESAGFASEVVSQTRQPSVSPPRIEIQQATGRIASELGLAVGSSVISRHQQRLIDGVPYSLQTTFYPMALVERGASQLIVAQDIAEGAIRYIENALGIRQAGTRDLITVRAPDSGEATFYGLPDDGSVAVFEIVRTGFDEDGQPFHATVTTYPADRNQFIMTSGTVPGEHPAGHGHATTPG